MESDNSLPFLDVLIVKERNRKLTTTLYQKPTHTNRFLNYNSQHSVSQKRGLIYTLLNKINSKLITKKKGKTIEIKKLTEALKHNNYPELFLKQTINRMNISKTKSRVTSNRQEKKGTVFVPYISGLSKKITRILKSFDVQVCTKPLKTIKDILPSTKDRIEPTRRQGGIYQIPSQDCSALYIGETGRNSKTRCAEHKRDLYPSNLAKIDNNDINKKLLLSSML